MAKNNLTPKQDVLTREFLIEVALAENVFNVNPSSKKTLIRLLYLLLNYQRLTDGRFVSRDKKISYKLGGAVSTADYPDEWLADYENALNAARRGVKKNEKQKDMFTTDYNDSYEADSRESSKDSSFWKALFSKDL